MWITDAGDPVVTAYPCWAPLTQTQLHLEEDKQESSSGDGDAEPSTSSSLAWEVGEKAREALAARTQRICLDAVPVPGPVAIQWLGKPGHVPPP